MKLALINPREVPPGGWHYQHPVTGASFEAPHLDDLIDRVTEHSNANEIAAPSREDIEQTNYRRLVDTHSHLVRVVEYEGRSLSQYWKGIQGVNVIARFERTGRPVQVSLQHATDRQNVCVKCPYNVAPKLQDKVSDALMVQLAGGRRLVKGVKNCGVCSCPLAAKTQLTVELLRESGDRPNKYPNHCWVRKEMS